MDKEFSEDSLKALISAEIRDAQLYDESEVSGGRVRAMEYRNGIMTDTPPQENWSRFVSRDVSDVIGWVLPGVIRVFTASDRMVDYEPRKPGDEEFSDQASDYANFVFWNDNDGYRILWDATDDSLLFGDGIVKCYWDDTQEIETTVHSGLTEEQIAILEQEQGVEIIGYSEGAPIQDIQQVPQPDGSIAEMPIEVPTYNLKVKRIKSNGKLCITCVEPENFLIDREAISIKDARFTAHRDPHVTRSDLIEMGFDPEIVESIPRYNFSYNANSLEANVRDPLSFTVSNGDKATDRIELYEVYVKVDVDGDGIAEMVRAYVAGADGADTLLDWQVWEDETPFENIPCEPVPHRFHSRSLAGEVMDIQQVKTTIARQLLNNAYAVNNPQSQIEAGSVINMDALLNKSVGGTIIRTKGSAPVSYDVVPSIMGEALQALEAMDRVTEMRTGVSRATMALDPTTLQNQTATANQNQRDSAYSQIELIARNQSEGWRKVFRKILRLVVKHQDQPRMIRLRDKWVAMDPRVWNADMDAYVNVGLGTGSRDRDMAMLNNISQTQIGITDRFQASGMTTEAIDMIPRITKTLVKIVEASGLKNADSYYPDIKPEQLEALKQQAEQAKTQPPPEVQAAQAKMQADMQLQQAKLQGEQQKAQAQMVMDKQKAEADLMQQAAQFQQELQLKYEQMAQELQLKREQLAAELQLKREQLAAELELKRELGTLQAVTSSAVSADTQVSSDVNVGGYPG